MAILDLIEYPDSRANEIVHRIPEYGSGEFRLGSQCVVRESQRAVFSRDGRALDVLGPGRHTLSTANIPILSELFGLPFGGKSPFRAEVFYVNVREFTDLKWGTVQPIVYRDTDFGMVRLRAFGTYSVRVHDVQLFVNQVVGTRATYLVDDIEDFLRSIILTEFNDMVGETMTSILDLPLLSQEIASAARHALTDDFERLGLELLSFQIMSVTPPEEVQQADRRAIRHGRTRKYERIPPIPDCAGYSRDALGGRGRRRWQHPRRGSGPGRWNWNGRGDGAGHVAGHRWGSGTGTAGRTGRRPGSGTDGRSPILHQLWPWHDGVGKVLLKLWDSGAGSDRGMFELWD